MAFSATVIPVMIASPGDVHEYRAVARDVLHEWNYVHSEQSRLVLMPVGWDTHSSPELGATPQELINNRVLQDCDLLIGIFWTRLGTPTAHAASGTAEEIQRHVAAGKPAMLYFSEQPVAPESLDAVQYAALRQFRAWCEQRGLIERFNSRENLREKLTRHVQIALRDNPYLAGIIIAASQTQRKDERGSPDKQVATAASLSQEAKELLVAAANDPQGSIVTFTGLNGQFIQAGQKQFGNSPDRRDMVKWEYGLEELANLGLVREERPGKGSVMIFKVTKPGYQLAEQLNAAQGGKPS
jgi:hypothetical protein